MSDDRWDKHLVIHQRGIERENCQECVIEANHRQRVADLEVEWGSLYSVPLNVWAEATEALRKEYIAFYTNPGDRVVHRRGKTQALIDYCDKNPGLTVTAWALASHVECSEGTAYEFIREHKFRFSKIGTGTWVVNDLAAMRAADKAAASAPVAPADGPAPIPAPTTSFIAPAGNFGPPGKL